MKQLRRTIRKILLENVSQYEKLAIYLTGGDGHPDVESIRAAINLGDTLSLITVNEEFVSPTGWNAYFDLILDPEFFAVAVPHLETMRQKIDVNIIENQYRVQFIVAGKR
tara:strand:- start:252 stop:581 length:330 start_codon:yes stop_codon:yes gene_type:complete